MKTDRCRRSSSASTRTAAVLLAGLVVAAGLPAAGQIVTFKFKRKAAQESSSKELAQALALQVGETQKRFDESRRALHTVQGPGGKPAYLRQEVAGLITRTGEDLDQAIEKAQPSGTEPLRAWAAVELGRIQGELTPSPGPVASFPGLFAPRAVARVASLQGFGLPLLASAKPAPPKPAPPKPAPSKPDTIPAETSNRLLDQVGEVVSRIFVLAAHDDLEVKLWVGSTPARKATFRFWPQGKIKGSTSAPAILQTDGTRGHVLRGLYSYSATWGKGAVTQFIEYPSPAGASAARESGRLDLVNGSSFFCCRFNEQYCDHVDDEKDCR